MSPFDALRGILIIAAAYVIGSVPWGVIVARMAGGPDPRSMGSGRTGGSNMMRAVGPRLALLSGLLDAAKGAAAVLLAWALGGGDGVAVLAALAAVIGHSRSIFLHFGGGRGVAPSFGGLLMLSPLVACIILPIFIGVIVITKYSSLGSLSASLSAFILLSIQTAIVPLSPWFYLYGFGGFALVWVFHKDNIGRLLAGKERRIGTPRDTAPEPVAPAGTDEPGKPSA